MKRLERTKRRETKEKKGKKEKKTREEISLYVVHWCTGASAHRMLYSLHDDIYPVTRLPPVHQPLWEILRLHKQHDDIQIRRFSYKSCSCSSRRGVVLIVLCYLIPGVRVHGHDHTQKIRIIQIGKPTLFRRLLFYPRSWLDD